MSDGVIYYVRIVLSRVLWQSRNNCTSCDEKQKAQSQPCRSDDKVCVSRQSLSG